MPTCSRCKQDKPDEQFFKRADRPSGRMSECKACRREKYDKPRAARNHAAGRCYCGREREEGKARCAPCNAAQRKTDAKSRSKLRANGTCYRCRKIPAASGHSCCDACSILESKRQGAHGAGREVRERLFREQNGECPICGAVLESWFRRRYAVVDHDHKTGQLRGLLHNRCNLGIGLLGDSAARLRAAADYLERYGC
jgi:hypothetical protein